MAIKSSRCTDRYIGIFRLSNVGKACDEKEENDIHAENSGEKNEYHRDFDTKQSSEKEAIES